MIIRSEDLKEVCSTILQAVDSSELVNITESVALKIVDHNLLFSVTNGDYYAEIRLPVDTDEQFNAVVKAKLFLKLIAQITTECINLEIKDNFMLVDGNGKYKIPLVYDDDKMLEIKPITIDNPTVTFTIDRTALKSIAVYNALEVEKSSTASNLAQKL